MIIATRLPWGTYIALVEMFDNMLQLMCFSVYFKGILNTDDIFRWEDAKGAYLKFINKLIMGHVEIFSYTNTPNYSQAFIITIATSTQKYIMILVYNYLQKCTRN